MSMQNDWQLVDELAAELQKHFGDPPQVAIVLGSGLGDVAAILQNRKSVEAHQLQGWPRSSVAGHAGVLHRGLLRGTDVFVQQGRVHLYEGLDSQIVVRPIRAALTWGIPSVILTNAAGGIDLDLAPGQLMVVSDHLNLTGANPLVGPNDESRGPRFPDLSELYDREYRELAEECAAELEISLGRGVYAGLLGPNYETPAEVRMLSALGAQAVGMSTVLEAIAAKHLGARVAAVSCITNRAAGLPGAILDHEDVQKMGTQAGRDLAALLAAWVAAMEGEGHD